VTVHEAGAKERINTSGTVTASKSIKSKTVSKCIQKDNEHTKN